jgi:tetratricopeptide (TPR) repeat protein
MSKTRDASVWVRTALGEMPVDISARAFPPEALTTGNWRALQEFLKAEEAWREDINGRRADESIRRLKMALELDPGFALAAGRLGDLLVAVGQEDEGLRYQQMAIGLMDQRDLTDRQSLKIRGMYYQDTGQDEKAENLFSLWAIEYPTEGVPLFYKSKSLMRLGRTAEAFALRSRAARLEPDNFALRLGSAQALLEAGDLEGADRAAALLPAGGLTDRLWSCIAFGRYQLDQVRLHLERMRGRNSDPFLCESYALSACLLAEQGQWGDAEKEIQPGIRLALDREIQTSIFANKLILAKIYLKQEKMEAARRECGEILELKPGFRRTMEVGCVLARTGATALAKGCMTRPLDPANKDETYLATPVYIHWRKRLSAEIAIAEKRGDGAARFVADAPPPALLDDWPEYLASAYLAAGKLDRAREPISALLQNPGRYWRLADTTGPGFFRWSVEQAIQHRLFAAGYADLVNLQKALHV